MKKEIIANKILTIIAVASMIITLMVMSVLSIAIFIGHKTVMGFVIAMVVYIVAYILLRWLCRTLIDEIER